MFRVFLDSVRRSGWEVGYPGVTYLARVDQLLQRPHRLADRRLRVGPVNQVQVDVVGAEQRQAPVDGGHDVLPRAVAPERLGFGIEGDAALGHHHHVLAAGAERPSEHLLGVARTVCGRGVEAGYAGVERLVNGRDLLIVVGRAVLRPAHGPAPEPDDRNLQIRVAEVPVFQNHASRG